MLKIVKLIFQISILLGMTANIARSNIGYFCNDQSLDCGQ